MARTSKSRGVKPFNMRSTNKTSFKNMGSSLPDGRAKSSAFQVDEEITMGEEKLVKTEQDENTKTDFFETKGKGYTPPTKTDAGDAAYAELSQEEKDKQDAKYIKANTRDILNKRQETTEKPKEKTPQEKMKDGLTHSKYYDPKTNTYRVRSYKYRSYKGADGTTKYTSQGRGAQTGDVSLDDWRAKYGSIEEQRAKALKNQGTTTPRGGIL
tara:strand:+ start:374 stop:1009 length:636 start_codon:yes stop_codon:yes gene_type:complete